MPRKGTRALCLSVALTAFVIHLLPRDGNPAKAAPTPQPREWHRFAPIASGWRVEVHRLSPWGDNDPPDGYLVVEMKDDILGDKGCLAEKCYYEGSQATHARRILRYKPSGRLAMEIDNVGKEQYSRSWHADGSYAGGLHWRDSKWLDGESVSPDRKVRRLLLRGDGDLITYGRNAQNRVHRWYAKGANILDKHFRDGGLSRVRLNRPNGEYLIADRGEEILSGKTGIWRRPSGQTANWHSWDGATEHKWNRPAPPQPYEKARAAFIKGFAATFEGAGLSWKGVGIDFLRAGESWPAVNR